MIIIDKNNILVVGRERKQRDQRAAPLFRDGKEKEKKKNRVAWAKTTGMKTPRLYRVVSMNTKHLTLCGTQVLTKKKLFPFLKDKATDEFREIDARGG